MTNPIHNTIYRIGTLWCYIALSLACNTKPSPAAQESNMVPPNHSDTTVVKAYVVGDVNNDRKTDTAYVVEPANNEQEMSNQGQDRQIKFNGTIPPLVINQSLGVFVQKTDDLTTDYGNEVVVFSRSFEGYWNYVYVFTYTVSGWKELARTKAFIADDSDMEQRIIRRKSGVYLVGDGWDDSKGGVTKRSIQLKIKAL